MQNSRLDWALHMPLSNDRVGENMLPTKADWDSFHSSYKLWRRTTSSPIPHNLHRATLISVEDIGETLGGNLDFVIPQRTLDELPLFPPHPLGNANGERHHRPQSPLSTGQ